jgi:hypothetical protein
LVVILNEVKDLELNEPVLLLACLDAKAWAGVFNKKGTAREAT